MTIGCVCTGCGETVPVYHMCDKETDNEIWCDICWQERPCDKEHSKDCATRVCCGIEE